MENQLSTLIELSENGYNLNDFYVVSFRDDIINLQGNLTEEKEAYYKNMGHTFEKDKNNFTVSTKSKLTIILT